MLASGKVRSVEQYSALKESPQKETPEQTPGAIPNSTPISESASPPELPDEPALPDVPYRLPDRRFNSFEESVADLKDPNKDCSCTPDIFLAEYSGFIRKFIKDIRWYSTPQYEAVFPALTQLQIDYLRSQTQALCAAAEELLKCVERTNSA